MQITRFVRKIAKTLAMGSLSVAAFAGADPVYHGGYPDGGYYHDGGYSHDGGFYHDGGYGGGCNEGGCCSLFNNNCCNEPPTCNWGLNPPAYLHCGDCGCNGFLDTLRFRADFLWWRASEEGLDLGSEEFFFSRPSTSDEDIFTTRSRLKETDPKFDAGFRIGVSTICENCWDIALNWTYFHTKQHARGFANVDTLEPNFLSFWERADDFAFVDFAKSRWTLNLDLIDLEFGHKFFVSRCLVLRPNIGLRGARVHQKYQVEAFADSSNGLFNSFVHVRNDFTGVGPRVGLDLEFRLGCGISLIGQAAGSLLYGRFHRDGREFFDGLSDSETFIFDYQAKDSHKNSSRAITDLAFGLKWEHCFEWCCRSHPFALAITWEHHAFWDFNNFVFGSLGSQSDGDIDEANEVAIAALSRKHGDLYTQGLTISAEVGF